MATSLDYLVQRGHPYAIVDEVDSILIDEARTPLIISGEPETAAAIYYDFARVVQVARGVPHDAAPDKEWRRTRDYEFDEKHKTVAPTESASRRSSARCGSRTSTTPENSSSSTT